MSPSPAMRLRHDCRMLNVLKAASFSRGAYKVILDCNEKIMQFYERCGFEERERQMVCYRSKL